MNRTQTNQDTPLTPRKRAIVIGASVGIGAALVRKLAEEGYIVAALARRKEKIDALCAEINETYGEERALAYQHDVSDFESIPLLFQNLLSDLKQIDSIIYMAGIVNPVQDNEYDFAKDLETMEINFLGSVAWLNEAAQLFERLKAGQIVGISSVAGDRGRVGNPMYNTSKAAMSTYLESLRNRLARHGVNVLTVKPGFVDTAILRQVKPEGAGVTPDQAAALIYKAMKQRKQVVYTPWFWRYIMLVIQHIPSFIFRRLSI